MNFSFFLLGTLWTFFGSFFERNSTFYSSIGDLVTSIGLVNYGPSKFGLEESLKYKICFSVPFDFLGPSSFFNHSSDSYHLFSFFDWSFSLIFISLFAAFNAFSTNSNRKLDLWLTLDIDGFNLPCFVKYRSPLCIKELLVLPDSSSLY